MIGCQDDERFVVETAAFQLGDKSAGDRIRFRDIGIVRRLVRRMRLEEMKKEEERSVRIRINPFESSRRGFVTATLQGSQRLVL
jgi:hypothetical protein